MSETAPALAVLGGLVGIGLGVILLSFERTAEMIFWVFDHTLGRLFEWL